ncbi:Utp14 protein-domain-containing protein [Xylogone sp. PMI_703]|nr:Utp14 protein-domain-containing protein [Xylogone sp. PMI_703]
MAGRQAHGRPLSGKPKARKAAKKRVLDAYSIAAAENPDKFKIRKHRLGESEGEPSRRGKRVRDDDDEDEDETELPRKQRRGDNRDDYDGLDVEEGSDSEGNEWKIGQVDTDDDSELDSDEAFGESDEERFEGFAFSGSSSKKKAKKKTSAPRGMNLDEEDENEESDSELEDGDLGEDAIDLAAMLDATENDSDVEDTEHRKKGGRDRSESESEDEDEDEDESGSGESESEVSSIDEEDEADPEKLKDLQNMIFNLSQADSSNKASEQQRSGGANEYNKPSQFGLTARTKLTLEDLGLPVIKDPHIKKSLKLLEADAKVGSIKGKLNVPLAKRQQDRLDRSAAYDKAKETLNRWTDTVKHNRRADHLIFPLPDQDTVSAQANSRLQPTITSKPFNELEATIQNILEESGLAPTDGKDAEDKIREFEELKSNKLSLEEVKARRDQLRMARELLFREEAKAKRIKKIKSKTYRKIHRKQREKEERLNKEALAEAGVEPSEDEQEAQDRRRAEERMGAKHRNSKWAKSVKATGRAAWDEDARTGITEMAKRDEELRKRIEGRVFRTDGQAHSDISESESEDAESGEDEAEEQQRFLQQLNDIKGTDAIDDNMPGAKLANLKFMRKASEARKRENDALVDDIRRELNGEDSSEENDEVTDIGRRIFGPGIKQADSGKIQQASKLNEFEEPFGSNVDEAEDTIRGVSNDSRGKVAAIPKQREKNSGKVLKSNTIQTKTNEVSSGGAWSKVIETNDSINAAESKRRRHKKNNAVEIEELDLSQAMTIAKPSKPKAAAKATTTLEVEPDSDSDSDNAAGLPFAIRDQELIKRAFAGADVVGEFEAEKRQTIEDEDEKVIDNTLPGWGSWVGDGVSKKDKKRNKGRFLTKTEGIKEQNRKDARLERVIINEKRVKKNSKYLASNLPHPFETRQQYERSLRLPVGPEWTTKETFQDATKPRILLKPGVIAPMSKPLL